MAYFYQSFTELLHVVIHEVVGCRLCAVLPTTYLSFQLLLTPSIICDRSPVASPRSPTFPPIHVIILIHSYCTWPHLTHIFLPHQCSNIYTSTLFAHFIRPINNDPNMDRGKGGVKRVNGVTYVTSLVLLKYCSGDPSLRSTRYNNWTYIHVVTILQV